MSERTFTQKYLSELGQSEKDYLSDIAREALAIMETDQTPAQFIRLRVIVRILQPALQAMAMDGYPAAKEAAPQIVNGHYNIVR